MYLFLQLMIDKLFSGVLAVVLTGTRLIVCSACLPGETVRSNDLGVFVSTVGMQVMLLALVIYSLGHTIQATKNFFKTVSAIFIGYMLLALSGLGTYVSVSLTILMCRQLMMFLNTIAAKPQCTS